MYISRVTIKNFRNFKDFDVFLFPKTIVVGANRVGKSNLLTAIQYAIDPSMSSKMRETISQDDFFGGVINSEGIKISVEISSEGNDWIGDFDDAQIASNIARFTYWFIPKSDLSSDSPSSDEEISNTQDIHSENISLKSFIYLWYVGSDDKRTNKTYRVNSTYLQLISVHLLHALRDATDLLLARSRSTVSLSELLNNLDLDPNILKAVADEIRTSGSRLTQEQAFQSLIMNIRNHTSEMVGIFEINSMLNVVTGDENQLMKAFRLAIDDRELIRASLGETNILYFALLIEYIYQEQKRSKNNFVSLVFLEEPEAHVHPHIQRAIFRYFLDKVSSLLITTHSPHLASVAPLKSLVVLRNFDNEGTKPSSIRPLLEKNAISNDEIADIERYLDVTRSELVFSRGVILVEGTAESFIIPSFFNVLFGKEPDMMGISVVSVHGTNFEPFAKLLAANSLNIPCVVITDGDKLALFDEDGNPRSLQSILPGITRQERLTELVDEISNTPSKFSVFVGNYTLEIDLVLAGYGNEIVETFGSLFVQPTRPKNAMSGLVHEINKSEDIQAMNTALEKIENKGKGRFAQKLSPNLDQRCPIYISEALHTIYDWVSDSSA